mgnify:FL=1
MNVQIQSVNFDADKKLLEFIEKKVSKLDKFFDAIIGAEVFLKVENSQNENKKVEIRLEIPGYDLFAERICKTFEEAVDQATEALKPQIQKTKEKMRE